MITAQGVHEDIEKIKWNIQTNPVKSHSQFAEILIHLTTIRAFEGGQPWTRSHCWHRISRLAFLLRRLELCLWTSRHLWHYLYGTAASQASCCNCYLIDTWSTWSMEMVGNHSFTLTSGNGKRSRLRRLKNSIPQGPVLAPLLFNIYISDLPTTVSKKYPCVCWRSSNHAGHAHGDWQAVPVEEVLSTDMATVGE